MPDHREHDHEAVLAAFLRQLLDDVDRGGARPLPEYQARFPGFEQAVADEYAQATGADPVAVEPAEYGGRYRVERRIAIGGMGQVLEVWDRQLDRRLALKTLRPDQRHAELSFLARLQQEARVTAQLNHPGVVPVHDVGRDRDGLPYFTMDLVRGSDLGDILRSARTGSEGWSQPRVLGVLQRVCDAVGYAHSKGVVHRDLKPANVMVGRFGEVYVMDWGLARVVGSDDLPAPAFVGDAEVAATVALHAGPGDTPGFTVQGDVVGTPAYMAPEQARGELGEVGPPADVCAVGAILYELLAGRMPYGGDGRTTSSRAVLQQVLAGPPPPVAALAPGAPAELVSICERAMARAPHERYADVQALGDDLRAFLELRVVRAHQTGAIAELRKWVRRNRGVAVAGVGAVLALVGGLLLALVQRARADREAERADGQARLADASLDDAMEVVERMLSRFGHDVLLDVPQAEELRQTVLRDSQYFYERFLSRRGDDPTVRRRTANAAYRLATTLSALGDREGADAACARATELYRQLVAEDGDTEARQGLAMVHNQRAIELMNHGDRDQAAALYVQALTEAEALVEDEPDNLDNAILRARVLHNLAVVNRGFDGDAALRRAEEAVAAWQAVVDRSGDDHRSDLATAHATLAAMHYSRRELEPAGRSYRTAIALSREVVAAGGGSRSARTELARSLSNLGVVELQGDPHAAEASHRQAIDIQRGLVADFPRLPQLRSNLGSSLSNLAGALRMQQRLDEALPLVEEALQLHRQVLVDEPGRVDRMRSYQLACRTAHRILVPMRRHVRAAELAEQMAEDAGDNPDVRAEAAANLAACIAPGGADPDLDEAERAALAERRAVRAVEILRAAVVAGFALDQGQQPRFRPLHGRADYAEVVRLSAQRNPPSSVR